MLSDAMAISVNQPAQHGHIHQRQDYRPPEEAPWQPLFLDEHLLVVDKPSGLLTVPGRGEHLQDCLIHRVQRHCPEALIVHRLDMDTSGLVLLGRGAGMQRALSQLFMQRLVDKQYQALVHGHPPETKGEVDLPLSTDWPNRPRQQVDFVNGKPSRTLFQVMNGPATGLPEQVSQGLSRMLLKPLTGRSHQLRVHCLAMGHPIAGDPLYGGALQVHAPLGRLMLHATQLSFVHPVTGQSLVVTSPCPF
jgi:tRNA pseudouridine32 synthase/23S rRNA pseudouridine746 synthase